MNIPKLAILAPYLHHFMDNSNERTTFHVLFLNILLGLLSQAEFFSILLLGRRLSIKSYAFKDFLELLQGCCEI
jgi:hypothetical protein